MFALIWLESRIKILGSLKAIRVRPENPGSRILIQKSGLLCEREGLEFDDHIDIDARTDTLQGLLAGRKAEHVTIGADDGFGLNRGTIGPQRNRNSQPRAVALPARCALAASIFLIDEQGVAVDTTGGILGELNFGVEIEIPVSHEQVEDWTGVGARLDPTAVLAADASSRLRLDVQARGHCGEREQGESKKNPA